MGIRNMVTGFLLGQNGGFEPGGRFMLLLGMIEPTDSHVRELPPADLYKRLFDQVNWL